MDAVPLPIPEDVRDLLRDLLAKGVACDPDRKPAPETLPIVAKYVGDDDELLALTCWELPLAAHAGAALAMLPAGHVADALKAGRLEGMLEECFAEVANIVSRWLHTSSTPHLRFVGLSEWDDASVALVGAGRVRGFVVSIEGGGSGKLVCVAKDEPAE
jgi:hypothetical protein